MFLMILCVEGDGMAETALPVMISRPVFLTKWWIKKWNYSQ